MPPERDPLTGLLHVAIMEIARLRRDRDFKGAARLVRQLLRADPEALVREAVFLSGHGHCSSMHLDALLALHQAALAELPGRAAQTAERRRICAEVAERFIRDRDQDLAAAAMAILAVCLGDGCAPYARELLRHRHAAARGAALLALGAHGDRRSGDFLLLLESLRHDAEIPWAAIDAITDFASRHGLEPDEASALAASIGDLPHVPAAPSLLRLLLPSHAELHDRTVVSLAGHKNCAARELAAVALGARRFRGAVPLLERLVHDRTGFVRRTALAGLRRHSRGAACRAAVSLLNDRDESVRLEAVRALAPLRDPALLERLLALSRDPDDDVRAASLQTIAPLDDEQVLAALVCALEDESADVRDTATQILEGKQGPVPSLASAGFAASDERPWLALVARWRDAVAWGRRAGHELTSRPITIRSLRDSLGRTTARTRGGAIDIEVSILPIASGHRHGVEIVRGLILHEIGHHLYDLSERGHRSLRGIARAEGVGTIFDILCDERLERRLRARRPVWGRFFDRLASYAFAQEPVLLPLEAYARIAGVSPEAAWGALRGGRLPGRLLPAAQADGSRLVRLSPQQQHAMPGFLTPHMRFLAYLRLGIDPRSCPDPRVAQALAVVPGNLKTMDSVQLLELSRRIGGLLGNARAERRRQARLLALLSEAGHVRRAILRQLWRRRALRGGYAGAAGESGSRAAPLSSGPRASGRPSGGRPPTGLADTRESTEYERLSREEALTCDREATRDMLAPVLRQVRELRACLSHIAARPEEEFAAKRGRRLDMARVRTAAVTRSPDLFVRGSQSPGADAYIGILIDRSGSMDGERIRLAKTFAAIVAESGRGIPGLEGHVSAFDHQTFYRLGDFRSHAIAALEAGGGNNDAGGLAYAAELARRSRRRNRLLVMISDGMPTECTVAALEGLVKQLTREGLVCCQVAVAPLDKVAFPHHVDVSGLDFEQAVHSFGRLVTRLTAAWR